MHALALTYRLDTNHSSNGTKNNIITFSRFLAPLRPLASSTPPFVAAGTAMALNMPLDIVRVSSSDYKECWNIWIVYTLASDSSSPPPKKIKLSSSDSTHIREIDRNSINAVKKVADGLWSHSQQLLYFWQKKQALDLLFQLALRASVPVPASNAAVERIVSHGGLVFSAHLCRMTDKSLTSL